MNKLFYKLSDAEPWAIVAVWVVAMIGVCFISWQVLDGLQDLKEVINEVL